MTDLTINLTAQGRASFAQLDTPSEYNGIPTAYTIDVILTDKKTLDNLNKKLDEIIKDKWGKKPAMFRPTIKNGNFKIIKKTGEVRREYKDKMYITATNKNIANIKDRPTVVDGSLQEIDPKEVFFGDLVNVSITLAPYDMGGVSGISVRLNHVQLVKKGTEDMLATTVSIEDAFDVVRDKLR